MKSCPPFESLSRAASEGISAAMHTHVRRCEPCRETLRRLDQLGKAARALPAPAPDAGATRRQEQQIFGRILQARQQPARRWARIAGIAAVAAVILVIVLRVDTPSALELRGTVVATPGARFQHLVSHATSPGDEAEVVRLEEGRVAVEVQHLQPGERFVVATSDAEVEVRGTSFTVAAAGGLLQEVAVHSGRVEVRFDGVAPVLLQPGQRWTRPAEVVVAARAMSAPAAPEVGASRGLDAVASRRAAAPVAPEVGSLRGPGGVAPRRAAAPIRRDVRTRVATAGRPELEDPLAAAPASAPLPLVLSPPPAPSAPPLPAAAEPPLAAERAFAAAWDMLRAGNAAGAAAAFGAIQASGAPSLAEDAAYWQIVARGQAGDAAGAVPAMEDFLRQHSGSSRAGEVHLMLGLRRLEAGAHDEALRHLREAAADPLPAVRVRATAVLERMGDR